MADLIFYYKPRIIKIIKYWWGMTRFHHQDHNTGWIEAAKWAIWNVFDEACRERFDVPGGESIENWLGRRYSGDAKYQRGAKRA